MTTKIIADMLDSTEKTISISSSANSGKVPQLNTSGLVPTSLISTSLSFTDLGLLEKSADPSNPAEGEATIWMSDGTGAGDDGDIMIKITAGGSTKTATLIDFSAV
tara:strand:- start:20255 stop:20572 length:318 start_codon:yes stop_codon:yes gene_type:complete